jgi:hypothetical protein
MPTEPCHSHGQQLANKINQRPLMPLIDGDGLGATGVILGASVIFRDALTDGGKLRGVRWPGRLGCGA